MHFTNSNSYSGRKHTMKKALKVIALILALSMVACGFASCGSTDTDTTDGANATDNAVVEKKDVIKVVDIALTEEQYGIAVSKDQDDLLDKLNAFIKESKENGVFDEITNKYFGDGTPEGITSAELDTSKDQLVVATNAEFAPFEYKDGDKFMGIEMEFMAKFAESLGKELVIKDGAFDAVLNEVDSGNADIAAAALTISEERLKQVNFTDAFYTASQKVITLADDTKFADCTTKEGVETVLNSFDSDVKIGFQNGTTGEFYTKGSDDYAGYNVTAAGYDSAALAVQDMINGNIDYVITDEAPANALAEKFNAAN